MKRGLGRLPALDGLRGLAVLLVIGSHSAVSHMALGGPVGVTVFFVLSGFLITSQLLAFDRVDFRGFWLRRARRLGPALLLLLVACFPLYIGAGWSAGEYLSDALPSLFYMQNFHELAAGWTLPFGHLWSLSVEEQFYLAFPFVVALLRVRPAGILWFAVIVGGLSAGLRIWLTMSSATAMRAYFGLDCNAYALLLGSSLAALAALGWRPGGRSALLAFGLVLVGGSTMFPATVTSPNLVGITAALGAAAIITAALAGPIRPLEWAPLRFCGRVSYGWYLWQVPLLTLTYPTYTEGHTIAKAAVSVVALVVATLSYQYVERPVLRGRRVSGSRRAPQFASH